MKNWLVKWLKDHSITTHTVASAWVALSSYYAASSEFRQQVAVTYATISAHVPNSLKPWIGIAVGCYVWYRNGKKTQDKFGQNPSGSR